MVLTNSSDDPFVSSCRWILTSSLSFRSRVCRTLFWTCGRTGTCAASCACVVCASTCVFRTFCCEPSRTHLSPSAWLSPSGPLDFAGTDPLPPLPPMNACHVARETRGGFLSFLPLERDGSFRSIEGVGPFRDPEGWSTWEISSRNSRTTVRELRGVAANATSTHACVDRQRGRGGEVKQGTSGPIEENRSKRSDGGAETRDVDGSVESSREEETLQLTEGTCVGRRPRIQRMRWTQDHAKACERLSAPCRARKTSMRLALADPRWEPTCASVGFEAVRGGDLGMDVRRVGMHVRSSRLLVLVVARPWAFRVRVTTRSSRRVCFPLSIHDDDSYGSVHAWPWMARWDGTSGAFVSSPFLRGSATSVCSADRRPVVRHGTHPPHHGSFLVSHSFRP